MAQQLSLYVCLNDDFKYLVPTKNLKFRRFCT